MPYPHANAFSQTAPGTALEPKVNPSVIGLGNADTLNGTVPGLVLGSSMAPYQFVRFAPAVNGTQVSSTWTAGVAQTGNPGSLNTAGIGYSAIGVPNNQTKIQSAYLVFSLTGNFPASSITVAAQKASNPAAISGSNLPAGWTGGGVTTATAPIVRSDFGGDIALDVTAVVKEAVQAWGGAGRRINFRAASGNAGISVVSGPSYAVAGPASIQLLVSYLP